MKLLVVVALLLLASCAATPPAIGPTHPASLAAPESPPAAPSVLSRASTGLLFTPEAQDPRSGGHRHHLPGAAAPADASDVYVCPMHPEVHSSTPGDCPRCGMPLIKETKR